MGKTQKSTNNNMSSFGLIEKNMELSHIYLAVHRFLISFGQTVGHFSTPVDLLFYTVKCSERLMSSYLIYYDGFNVTFGKNLYWDGIYQYDKIKLIQSCYQRFVSMMKKVNRKKLLQQYTIIILHIAQEAYCRKPEIFPFLSTR